MLREQLLREWHWRLKRMPLRDLPGREALYAEMFGVFTEPRSAEEYEALLECGAEVEDSFDFWKKTTKKEDEIAFFRPSLEQAMVLNAWAPWARIDAFKDIDMERVPDFMGYEGGYRSVGNYSCNRGAGKTCSMVLDMCLWFMENDPSWKMWEWHEDIGSDGRKLSDMKYRVLPRPDWEAWFKRKRVRYNGVEAPPKGTCDFWIGYGRDSDWHGKLWLEFRKWMPKSAFGLREDGQLAQFKLEKRFVTKNGHNVIGKSMAAESDAWAGKAAWMVTFDEGMELEYFREGTTRIEGGGYFHQAYTPVDPANSGKKAQVAKNIFQRKPGYELVGDSYFFYRFRIADSSFLDPTQIHDNLRRWKGMGAEGQARMAGGFFDSSPVVFSNYRRELNVLPWTGAEIVAAINGKGDPELVKVFYKANIIRGADEGMANPTACVWGALLRTGETVYFRNWEKTGISITQRVESIIDLSGNVREEVKPIRKLTENEQDAIEYAKAYQIDQRREKLTGVKQPRYREKEVREKIRMTFMDYKAFKKDPNHPLDNWMENYRRAGLRVEPSAHIGPATRCDYLNELLMPDPTRRHLNPDQGQVGTRAYVSIDCDKLIDRFENYLHEQRKDGTFTDNPDTEDDHTVDGACYIVCARLRWVDPEVMDRRRGLRQQEAA